MEYTVLSLAAHILKNRKHKRKPDRISGIQGYNNWSEKFNRVLQANCIMQNQGSPNFALLSHFSHVQLCVTPIDSSPPGSTIPGILQARILEWVAISLSIAWKWKVKVKSLSSVWLFGTPWTVAYQAPPSMGFPRQEYWSGVPLPSPEWLI